MKVLEVRGPGGDGPFLVRWHDSERESFCFPGTDATVHHGNHLTAAR